MKRTERAKEVLHEAGEHLWGEFKEPIEGELLGSVVISVPYELSIHIEAHMDPKEILSKAVEMLRDDSEELSAYLHAKLAFTPDASGKEGA